MIILKVCLAVLGALCLGIGVSIAKDAINNTIERPQGVVLAIVSVVGCIAIVYAAIIL